MANDAGARGAGDLTIRNESGVLPMLWIGFYTTVLNILTLTIFRFWGRTHFRRRLWADTSVGGEPLEYTGRGIELFVGFVIAIFVLALPLAIGLLAAQMLLGVEALIIIAPFIYLFLFVLFGIAIFLARRYHLSRTRLRGIRFAQTGSAWTYGFLTLGYLFLTAITLGWFGPAMRVRLSRRLWANASYGSAPFAFTDTPEAKAEPVYASFALAWFGGALGYAIWAGMFFFPLMQDGSALDAANPDLRFIASLYISIIPLIIFVALCTAWHEAVMIRRIIKSLSIDNARFSSRLSLWNLVELAITNTLLIIFTLGFGYMAAQMRMWRRIANHLSLEGSIDFDAIKQSTVEAPSQGEGLADGLDIVSNF